MTKVQEKEVVHWQDLARQLGVDASDDLMEYFSGTVHFEGDEIENDELDIKLTPDNPINEVAMDSNQSEIEPSESAFAESEEPPSTSPAPMAPIAKSEETNQSANELQIDWATDPVKPKRKPKQKPTKPKTKRKPQPQGEEKPVAETASSSSHWDSLASTLGIDPQQSVTGESNIEHDKTLDTDLALPHEDADETGEVNTVVTSLEAESGDDSQDHDRKKTVLDDMFEIPETPFQDPEEPTLNSSDDEESTVDEPSTDDSSADEFENEYIEFEVEELDPGGEIRRLPSKPRAKKRPAGEDDSRDSRRDRQRRKPEDGRRRRRPSSADERPADKRPAAAESQTSDTDDRGSERADDDVRTSKQARRKQRNLPTWQETVDVIVDANLASRKKPARRRRGRGSRR